MAEIWQIGAGDKEKDLVPTMLESGLMIIGPGNGGDISSLDDQTLENNLRKTGEIEEKHIKSTVIFLKAFRDANEREIVVLKLGSVCFAVGAIAGKYKWDKQFEKVYSYWNKDNKYDSEMEKREVGWDLQHTRKVDWFVLKDNKAIYYFRRGIYAKTRFSRVGKKEPEREILHNYLEKLGYNNKNGKEMLEKIGDPVNGLNKYGFPIGKS